MNNERIDLESKYPNAYLEFNTWFLIESEYGELIDCNMTPRLWNFLFKEFFEEKDILIDSYYNKDGYTSLVYVDGVLQFNKKFFNSKQEATMIAIHFAFNLYETLC
jgi:hypothetical protein